LFLLCVNKLPITYQSSTGTSISTSTGTGTSTRSSVFHVEQREPSKSACVASDVGIQLLTLDMSAHVQTLSIGHASRRSASPALTSCPSCLSYASSSNRPSLTCTYLAYPTCPSCGSLVGPTFASWTKEKAEQRHSRKIRLVYL
jgi:hypothetical protein